MTDAVKRARELLAKATQYACRVCRTSGAMCGEHGLALDRLQGAAPDLLRELCEEVERLRDSDIGEALLDYDDAAIANESLRAQLTATRAALRETYAIAKRTFDMNLMTREEAERLDKLAKLAEEP